MKHDHTWKTTHYDALTHKEAIYQDVERYICAFCGIDYTYEGDEKYEIMKDHDIWFTEIRNYKDTEKSFLIGGSNDKHPCNRSSLYPFRQISGYKTVVDRQSYDLKKCSTCGYIDCDSKVPSGERVWTVKIETGTVPMPDFYVENNQKLAEGSNFWPWHFATASAKGSDGQVHYYYEKKTNPEDHGPQVPYAWNWFFEGYYTDKECTKKFDFNSPITCDMTLYVKWQSYTNGLGTYTIGNKKYVHYRLGNTLWRYMTCNGKTQKTIIAEGFGQNMRFKNAWHVLHYPVVDGYYTAPDKCWNVEAGVNIIEFGETEDTIIPWQEYTF